MLEEPCPRMSPAKTQFFPLAVAAALSYSLNVIRLEPKTCMNRALALVYPDVCQACRLQRATVTDGYVCSECWKGVRFIQAPFCERCGLPFEGDITTRFECAKVIFS